MFAGSFTDKDSFRGEDFSRYESPTLSAAFCGRLYGYTAGEDAAHPARLAASVYLEKGEPALAALEGAYVLIVWDGRKTIIARDHHGCGPQVYYSGGAFASSLREMKRAGWCRQVDPQALGLFLQTGYIPSGRSSFAGVAKLAAGSVLVHDNGSLSVSHPFEWSGGDTQPQTVKSVGEYADEYASLHESAIRRRIDQSRNVGILLSGGYDSGCNLAALRRVYDGPVNSYSIGFKGDNWSELPLARCMSEAFGTRHHTYEIDGSEIMHLPRIVEHLGDPFVEGGLMVNYAAMRLVGDDRPEVILGGDGNDQYFGTSAREAALHYLSRRYGLQPALRLAFRALAAASANDRAYRIRFHLGKILNILHGDVFGMEATTVRKLLSDPSQLALPQRERPDTSSMANLYEQHRHVTDIGKIIDQVILFKASRIAEMFGNHVAFPYLDTQLYDFLQRLPFGLKCHADSTRQIAKGNFTAKYLLKLKYKPVLPGEITTKKKQGGFAPMPIFFEDNKRRALLTDFIMQSSVVGDLLRRDAVERFVAGYRAESNRWFWYRQNQAIQLFNLLTLAVWWEIYVGGKTDIKF